MRIQHNILAMNAYRNYNTNTSALSKNLEKLSSGYKINRAGDDAAGLAISEKMRAQITGLNAASKNVKDGISLVKTAEGAMQEIQDMLNRMDYLATQSANGTYQDEVDRENLNKEMSALKTEINRIADSANFNGIKLLDGSLDTTKLAQDAVTETVTVDPTKENALTFESGKLADVGLVLGTNTVLHNEANGSTGTSFSVDLHNFKFDASKGNSMTMKMGDTEITLKATDNHKVLEGKDLVNAFLNGGAGSGFEITVDGKAVDTLDGMKINGQTMNVAKGDKDYRLTFTQKDAPATEADEINGAMNVTISGQVEAKKAEFSFDTASLGTTTIGGVLTINGQSYTIKDTDPTGTPTAQTWDEVFEEIQKNSPIEGYKITVDGTKVTMKATEAGEKTTPTIGYTPTKAGDVTDNPTAGVTGVKAVYETAVTAGLAAADKITINGTEYTVTATGSTTSGTNVSIDDLGTATDIAAFIASKATSDDYVITSNGANLVYTAKNTGAVGSNGPAAAPTAVATITAAGAGAIAAIGTASTAGVDEVKQSHEFTVTGWNSSKLGDFTGDVNGKKFSLNYDKLAAAGDKGLVVKAADGSDTGYIAVLEGDKLTFTAKVAGLPGSGNGAPAAAITNPAYKIYDPDPANTKKLSADDHTIEIVDQGAEGGEMQGITEGAHGDFNVSTTAIKNVETGGADRLASTFFELTEDMAKDGAVLTIGGQDYTFTSDEKIANGSNDGNTTYVKIGDDLLSTVKNLTEAAKGNKVWTVGHDGTRVTLTETVEHGDLADKSNKYDQGPDFEFDLSTKTGIEQSLGFVGTGSYTKENVISEATEGGKALNLQIGDTSDEFNQMKVSIGDMHVSAMKLTDEETGESTSIEDIDILTSENAQKAVDVIKNAINYVSGVRGDLGAYQNRLEHTANNLSVMAENIQDAESTIRDTDIAEEMMSYTKNNILVQSAQAMLAQANAVPQGVLQLLG